MHIEDEIKRMTETISSKELLDKILSTYLVEMREKESYDINKEYQESKQVLESALTNKLKEYLTIMESLFIENMQYSIGFGIKKGIYTGFEQYFVKESTKEPFNKFAHDELMTVPNMGKHKNYYDRRTEINKLFTIIRENLEKDNLEYLDTIYSTYDEKSLGVLRYSFYIGYRYALSIIEGIDPLGVTGITDKMLYTEYELSFTMTRKEKEQRKIWREEANN